MMLGLWIILMFGSGMPGLYIYGICWLSVVDLTDRWYITKMCKQPVRYGKSLPYLLLGKRWACGGGGGVGFKATRAGGQHRQ